MRIEGSFSVSSPREEVFRFFSNPANLGLIVPGCQECEVVDENTVSLIVEQKVAFLKGRFKVTMRALDKIPYERMSAVAEGKDPLIGSSLKIDGSLEFRSLSPEETEIKFLLDVSVFGKLGSLGFFVIKGKVKEMENQFVDTVRQKLAEEAGAAKSSASVV